MVGFTESIVAPGSKFVGSIDGPDSVRIFGRFEGDIKCTRVVRVGKGAKIEGKIYAPMVILDGELKGNIESAERVELGPESRMQGIINTIRIAMADGSFFEGKVNMPKKGESVRFVERRGRGTAEEEKR